MTGGIHPEVAKTMIQDMTEKGLAREAAICSWMRFLVGLSAGALAILASLGRSSSDYPQWIRRTGILSLALSILLGTLRIYGESRLAKAQEKNLLVAVRATLAGDQIPQSATFVKKQRFSTAYEIGCYAACAVALVSLSVLSW